ncbi:hypothetical protein [Halocatena pleomorpha]|uniref:Uncharacterized protein n=1 Tax=Halocatena pleomorpha TaxID=1785090 RepID=A0A3P3RLX8_9EURY|nr:hypothetical protein [Halocatena pleomorpha]RRJ33829.1 hypothetical protein EIK79_03335 [Halocatena pleomorpha]
MAQDTDIKDMFNHLCWYLCDSRERFVPPEETAVKSLADRDTTELEEAESRGYHRGSLAQFDGVIDFILDQAETPVVHGGVECNT